jgi:hypothetical protein
MDQVEEILSCAVVPKKKGLLERWLDQDAERADLFWRVIDMGYLKRSLPFAHVWKAIQEKMPGAPDLSDRHAKRAVDALLDQRLR